MIVRSLCWLLLLLLGFLLLFLLFFFGSSCQLLLFLQVIQITFFIVLISSLVTSKTSGSSKTTGSGASSEAVHSTGVESSKSLVGILFFLVFINPFRPVHLNILIFGGRFDEPGPECSIEVFLLKNEKQVVACFCPLGILGVDFIEKFDRESILSAWALSLEVEVGGGEIDFVVVDVHKRDFDEDSVLALSPSGDRVAE